MLDRTFFTKVVGVTFQNDDGSDRQRIIRKLIRSGELDEGTELILMPQPTNPYDSNCIQVQAQNGQTLGSLSRDLAAKVTAQIKQGYTFKAYVAAQTGGDIGYSYGLNIKIERYRNFDDTGQEPSTEFSSDKAQVHYFSNPEPEMDKATSAMVLHMPKEGETILFGRWPYSVDGSIRPLEWIALRVYEKDRCALLITKNCIDYQPCDIIDEKGVIRGASSAYSYRWSTSALFSWLNRSFYAQCFNHDEKNRIMNQTITEGEEHIYTPVNLISSSKVLSLLPRPEERQAVGTPYCTKGKIEGFIPWWLSDTTGFTTDAAAVFADGSVCVNSADESQWTDFRPNKNSKQKRSPFCHGIQVDSHLVGVRPTIKIKFD